MSISDIIHKDNQVVSLFLQFPTKSFKLLLNYTSIVVIVNKYTEKEETEAECADKILLRRRRRCQVAITPYLAVFSLLNCIFIRNNSNYLEYYKHYHSW